MKTMIRSFASALVAVMTLGLVQTAQAEPCSIEQLVEPEGACTITQDKTQAEGGEEVKFTISNIKEGYQVEDVKVFLYGEGGEIYPDYNYEEDYYSFNMPEENVYIYVRCEKPTTEYSITIPEFKGGSVTSDVTSAQEGAPVTLTVKPDKGYELASILVVGDGVTIEPEGAGSTYTFTMPPSAVEVQATFKEKLYKINIPEFKGGTVTSNVASTNEGATVTLTVTPDKGYELDTIKVDGIDPEKGEGSTYTFEMPASDVTVMATFKEKLYKINIPEFKGGTVTSNVASTNEGATVTLTVTPDPGYELDTIKVDGIDPEKGEGSTYTFEMPASDVEVQATFKEAVTKYSITTVADPENTCEFEVYPVEMEAPEGDWVEFRFNLADGANFVSLDVYNTDDPSQSVGYEEFWWNGQQWYRFEMPDYDVTIKVKTESGEAPATAYTITTVADPEGTCLFTVSPESLMASEGAPVDFRFDLADGANFVSLTVYNTADPTQTISEEDIGTYVDEDGVTWYYFTMPDYDVTIKVTTESGGTPEPGSSYKIDTSVTPSGACEFDQLPTSAQSGTDVYFELHFASGATLGSLTVWNMSVGGVSVEYQQSGKGYTFKMPDGDVLIQVFCSDPEPPKDPEILDVTAQQRYPWNGLVDIGYTVTGTIPDGYVLKVSAMDMKTYDTFDAKTITAEEFPLSEGSHTLKWDMNADGYTTEVSDSIFFMVSAESAAGASFGAISSTVKLDLRTGTTREIALGATETLTFSTDYEGGPTPPVQEGVQLWENGPYFAETNIGAKNPQDYGYYFWWGDTVGYQYSENEYGEGVWTAVDGSGKVISFDADDETASQTNVMSVEDLQNGGWIDDNGNLVVSDDASKNHDAARAHLGSPWRMMTDAELQALVAAVDNGTVSAVWETLNGVNGMKLMGTGAYKDNSIFLPAAGRGLGSDLIFPGSFGVYWSSTPNSDFSSDAWDLGFGSSGFARNSNNRYGGFSVRPVQSAAANGAASGASNEGETVTITVNGKTLKSGLIESGTVDWTPTEPGEYELHHIVNSADGSTEITNLVARYNVQAPTTVEVMPLARSYTSEIGAYTNGVLLTATVESTYIVNSNATVDVVFEANTSMGRYFKVNGVYTSIVTNTITASTDPYVFRGPLPDTGKKVGDSAYAFVDGGTCTIVGSGTADTRLSTVVSPGAITSAVIQPGITEIGARFFKDFKWLNAVTGGQDLKTVGEKAFYKCFSLETIDLDCTAVPEGMDESVVYQTALKSDGSTYQIPEISVKNHVKMLFGKKSLNDADWTCLGPSEGKSIYEQDGYQFFQIRLVKEEGNME